MAHNTDMGQPLPTVPHARSHSWHNLSQNCQPNNSVACISKRPAHTSIPVIHQRCACRVIPSLTYSTALSPATSHTGPTPPLALPCLHPRQHPCFRSTAPPAQPPDQTTDASQSLTQCVHQMHCILASAHHTSYPKANNTISASSSPVTQLSHQPRSHTGPNPPSALPRLHHPHSC
jgi:hypothetical protein